MCEIEAGCKCDTVAWVTVLLDTSKAYAKSVQGNDMKVTTFDFGFLGLLHFIV